MYIFFSDKKIANWFCRAIVHIYQLVWYQMRYIIRKHYNSYTTYYFVYKLNIICIYINKLQYIECFGLVYINQPMLLN